MFTPRRLPTTQPYIWVTHWQTAATLAFAVFQLAKRPHEQQKLSEEIERAAKKNEIIRPEMMEQLKYLKAFVKECAR